MHPNTLISLIAIRGLRMPFIPGGGRPEWTAQEAAMACQGLPPRIYDALVYTYAGDRSVHHRLKWELWGFGHRWREQDNAYWRSLDKPEPWPELVNDGPYMMTLAEMLLLETAQPWRFARHENSPTPDLRRVILGVGKDYWRRSVSPIYEAMTQEFTIWLSIGCGRMRKWLRKPEDVCASD